MHNEITKISHKLMMIFSNTVETLLEDLIKAYDIKPEEHTTRLSICEFTHTKALVEIISVDDLMIYLIEMESFPEFSIKAYNLLCEETPYDELLIKLKASQDKQQYWKKLYGENWLYY